MYIMCKSISAVGHLVLVTCLIYSLILFRPSVYCIWGQVL